MEPAKISEEISRMLHLETFPVAITLYRDRSEMRRPPLKTKHNFCQLISMARFKDRTNTTVAENEVCAMGACCLGLIKTPESFTSGKAAYQVYTGSREAAVRFMSNVYKIGDRGKQYDGVKVAPLSSIKEDEEASALVMYVTPLQAMSLIHASLWDNGEKVTADSVAEGAMCSAIAFAVEKQKPIVAFPCTGDRTYSGTQNHELVYAAPYAWAKEKLVGNLEKVIAGATVPVAPYMYWTPVMDSDYTLSPKMFDD